MPGMSSRMPRRSVSAAAPYPGSTPHTEVAQMFNTICVLQYVHCTCLGIRSLQKCDLERFAPIAFDKRANVRESLSSWFTRDSSKWFVPKILIFCIFLTVFHCFPPFLCPRTIYSGSLSFKEQWEQIAHSRSFIWAISSEGVKSERANSQSWVCTTKE